MARCSELLALIALIGSVAACAAVRIDHTAVPVALVDTAHVRDFEAARSWADAFSPVFLESAKRAEAAILGHETQSYSEGLMSEISLAIFKEHHQ